MKKKSLLFALGVSIISAISPKAHASEVEKVDDTYKNTHSKTIDELELEEDSDENLETEEFINEEIGFEAQEYDFQGFSDIEEKSQDQILAEITQAINKAKKEFTQVSINEARESIPTNLANSSFWLNSYSQTIDKIQQKLIDTTLEAIEKAEKSNSNEDIMSANLLISDLLNTKSEKIKSSAIEMKIRLDKVLDSKGVFLEKIQKEIFELVNKERVKAGKKEFTYNENLEKYSKIKSKDMGDKDYLDHKDLDGELMTTKMNNDSFEYSNWGENIAYLQYFYDVNLIAEELMNMWMESEGHKENILSDNYDSMSVGVYLKGDKIIATQNFAK